MPRLVEQLTALKVSKISKPGYHADGGGLYLQVSSAGTKSWIFRYMMSRKAREMGLGSLNDVSLADARSAVKYWRNECILKGIDPVSAREAAKAAERARQSGQIEFDECARVYIEAHRAGWKNTKHAEQWINTIATYASPTIGRLPVHLVDTSHILKVLEPIWATKPETASRLRGRIESILDWAKVRKYRDGENPARWRGHLDKLLPHLSKSKRTKHHPALPYSEAAEFMKALRKLDGTAPRALEAIVLTACRVSEAVNAQWAEIDFKARIWTIPGERTKSGRPHRVPLTDDVVRVLKTMQARKTDDFVFPGRKHGKPLTSAACLKLIREMGYGKYTVHGFRSTFRDWAAECTNYPRELAEAALSHVLSDKTEAAYQRGDLLRKRGLMMEAWAKYCAHQRSAARVVTIGAKGKNR